MRTTLDIDDDLLRALRSRYPRLSKRDAVERAIGTFLARDAARQLQEIAGTVEIDDVSSEMRNADRHT
jgi:Arc/MetJ family transcription regulator